jgi:hypothetical protein
VVIFIVNVINIPAIPFKSDSIISTYFHGILIFALTFELVKAKLNSTVRNAPNGIDECPQKVLAEG